MNDKTTEVLKIMCEIMQLQREISNSNRETVDKVNQALALLAES